MRTVTVLRRVIMILLLSPISFLIANCGGGSSSSTPSTDLTIGLPFKNYSIDGDSIIHDTGSGIIHASVSPYGAHFAPITGHLWGDEKINLPGYFARTDAELTLFVDVNGNGICEYPADTCGFDGGADIFSMLPTYVAPVDATVVWVSQEVGPGVDAMYLNGQPKWQVQVQLNSRYMLRLGHLGSIAPALHDKILAATGIDTDTYTAGDNVNLLSGLSLSMLQGEELAYPQLVASEVAGHPGFYQGPDVNTKYPWVQMEFALTDGAVDSNVCVYDLLSAAEKTDLNNAMIADMQSPSSLHYGGSEQASIWKWGAEAVMCPVYYSGPDTDFSTIYTYLGGWVERPVTGLVRDELFAIVEIQTGSPMYNASNYNPGVTHLVSRQKVSLTPAFNWTMPDGTTPNDINYPTGEVLETTANTLLIKWRDFSYIYTAPVYQRVAFELDANGLKVKWGNIGASSAAAIQPVLAGDVCNDTDVICYYHKQDLHL